MEKKQNKGRWFLIQHKCGAEFTMNTVKIVELFDKGAPFKCPGCFEDINKEIKDNLKHFCSTYHILIHAFNKQHFQIGETEITDEDSGS